MGAGEPHTEPNLTALDIGQPPPRVQTTVSRIIRDSAKAEALKELYDSQCQVCGTALRLADGRRYAEAHHLRPLGAEHQGRDGQGNMVILCPNHHALFDLRALAIDPATGLVDGPVPDAPRCPLALSRHELDTDCVRYAWGLLAATQS